MIFSCTFRSCYVHRCASFKFLQVLWRSNNSHYLESDSRKIGNHFRLHEYTYSGGPTWSWFYSSLSLVCRHTFDCKVTHNPHNRIIAFNPANEGIKGNKAIISFGKPLIFNEMIFIFIYISCIFFCLIHRSYYAMNSVTLLRAISSIQSKIAS